MMRNVLKYWNYSILIGILGWCYLILLGYMNSDKTSYLIQQLPKPGKYESFWFRTIAIGFGIIGIYYGIKMISKNKILNILGILISLCLIIASFLPILLPLWFSILYK